MANKKAAMLAPPALHNGIQRYGGSLGTIKLSPIAQKLQELVGEGAKTLA